MKTTISFLKKIFEYIIILLMSYFSGWRDIGFDRDNYIANYNAINYTDDFLEKLFFAKDLMFLGVSHFSNLINDNPKLAFLISCSIALISKYVAAKKMGMSVPIVFMVLYFIFLAPGLEFAAMRGAMAVGFLMLAIESRNKSYSFFVYALLAVLSHITVIVVVVMLVPKINKYIAFNKINYIVIFIVGLVSSGVLIELYPYGDAYSSNSGALNAYMLPAITLLIASLLYSNGMSRKKLMLQDNVHVNYYLKAAVFGLISFSFGLTGYVVTAATRYLEIAWFLMLMSIFVDRKINYMNLAGMVFIFIWLSVVNVGRNTWLAIYDPSSLW